MADTKQEEPATAPAVATEAKESAPATSDASADAKTAAATTASAAPGEKRAADNDDTKPAQPRRRKKRRGWDVGAPSTDTTTTAPTAATGADIAAKAAALLQQQIKLQQQAGAFGGGGGGVQADNPKQRELYVGNLQRGITQDMVLTFFNTHAILKPFANNGLPCVRAQLDSGGTFAFVEFRTPEIATAALAIGGEMLWGRPVKTGRPRGYVDPSSGSINNVAPAQQPNTSNKKAREIYVGNITVGVTKEMLEQLFDTALGPNVVVGSHMNESGKFCFIEFKTPEIASKALSLNGIDLVGRQLRVGRPSGYAPPAGMAGFGGAAGLMGGMNPMTLGLTGMNANPLLGLAGLGGIGAGLGGAAQQQLAVLAATGGLSGFLAQNQAAQAALAAAAGGPGQANLGNLTNALPSNGVGAATLGAGAAAPSLEIVLENMITEHMLTDDQEYKECQEDIRLEAENHGEVTAVEIPRDGLHRGKVFIKFKDQKSAASAVKDFQGRSFDGNTVQASYK